MRVLFAGTPAVALPALQALVDSEHDVVGVLTRPPAPAGRRRRLTPSPVHQAADDHGIPVITGDRPHEEQVLARITDLRPEVAAVVAYGALLREPALSALPHGWINLHFSLLPAWRGAAPVQHALRAGDTGTGVSTFQIEAGLDTGPVFATEPHPIRPWHTAGDLLNELAGIGAEVLVRTLDGVAVGTATAVPQANAGITYAPRWSAADALIDWTAPAPAVDRLIRATTPAPGAWTQYEGRRVKIAPVRPSTEPAAPEPSGKSPKGPGHLVPTSEGVLVGTGTTPVLLGQVAPAGKGWMDAADWARGARLPAHARFSTGDADG